MRSIVVILFILLLLSLAGNFFLLQKRQPSSHHSASGQRKKYLFLSSRVFNPNYSNDLIVNFLPLREQIHKQVDPYSSSFALYFEYLPTGTTIGINEDKEFTAESLLKVPVVMA